MSAAERFLFRGFIEFQPQGSYKKGSFIRVSTVSDMNFLIKGICAAIGIIG